ncbi:MAG: hypothetical protein ACPGSB_02105 [Opitutales bacterium]
MAAPLVDASFAIQAKLFHVGELRLLNEAGAPASGAATNYTMYENIVSSS